MCVLQWCGRFGSSALVWSATLLGLSLFPATGAGQDWQHSTPGAKQEFEVASFRLSDPKGDGLTKIGAYGLPQFRVINASLPLLIGLAYGVDVYQIENLPKWADAQQYDLEGKAEEGTALTYETLKPRLQHLLEQRLGLTFHRAMKDFSGYALVAGPGGPKTIASHETVRQAYIMKDRLKAQDISMEVFASMLGHPVGHPVVDRTGLPGEFDFDLRYSPQDGSGDLALPDLFTAVQEQLGLKLVPQRVPVEMFVLDRVSRVPVAD